LAFETLAWAFFGYPLFETATASDKSNVLAAELQEATEVILAISGIADAVILGVIVDERVQFFTFAHIGTATDLALMLGSARINPAPELEESRVVPLGGIGGDRVKDVAQFLVLKDGGNEDLIRV